MTKTGDLLRILREELKVYRKLYNLLKKEKDAIVSFSISELEKITKEKDSIVLQLRLLEDERKRLIEDFASNRQCGKSLIDIYNHTKEEELLQIRSELYSILQSIEELNEINRIFIERATLHLKTSTTFLQSLIEPVTTSTVISKEV